MKAGDVIGEKYRLARRIGKGANGIVWEATNTETETAVALKLLVSSADADQRERLLREGKACGRISHPNVVEVLDVAIEGDPATGGMPFLVMPLLKGKTLAEALLGKPLTLQQSLGYLRDIGRGLVAAHAADVVHRDLKPQNVFLHEEEGEGAARVKILDFGISRINTTPSSLTGADRTLGSPQYMSPEQLLGSKVDQRSDLWSFGVIAFQLFARRLPFTGVNVLATLTKVQSGEIPKLPPVSPSVDAALSKLVASCLVRDIDARIQTAAECVKALDELLDTLPEPSKDEPKLPEAPAGLDDAWGIEEAKAPPKPAAKATPMAKETAAKPIAPKPGVTVAVATVGAGKSPVAAPGGVSPLRRRLGALTKPVEKDPAENAPASKEAESVELEPDDLSLATGDLQITEGEVPKVMPASRPPKPPPKPQARKDSTDHAVAAVFADLGLEDAPKKEPPKPISAPRLDEKPFEDLRIDLAESDAPSPKPAAVKGDDKPAREVAAQTEEPASGGVVEAEKTDDVVKADKSESEKAEEEAEVSSSKAPALILTPTPEIATLADGEPDAKPAEDPIDEPGAETASDAASGSPISDRPSPSRLSGSNAFEEDVVAPPPRVSRRSLTIGAVAAVGVILVVVLIASLSGGSKPGPEASSSSTPTTSSKPAGPAPTPPPPTATAIDTQAIPAMTSAEPPPSASASASAAPSASASAVPTKPPVNPNWKPRPPLAQPTTI